jgi:hypothetical protein
MVHQLAARKILGQLKDGTSHLHAWAKRGYGRGRALGELVKREGVRVGLKYGVASDWTSFVAVVRQEEEGRKGLREGEGEGDGSDVDFEFVDVNDENDDDDGEH